MNTNNHNPEYTRQEKCITRMVKRYLMVCILCVSVVPVWSQAPSPAENFVRKEIVRVEGATTDQAVINLTADQKITAYQYIDGLGRQLQSVGVQGSPQKKDIIQPAFYDAFGRPTQSYFPYRVNDASGAYHPSAITEQSSFYASPPVGVPNDAKAYGNITFEASRLGRVLSATRPGSDYQSTSSTVRLKVNDANAIRRWSIVSNLPQSTGTYPAATLSIEETVDEAGATTRTYKDLAGRVVLSQVQADGGGWLDTYYVYSDHDELLFIIPPRASTNFTPDQTYADLWCFQFEYDNLKRQIASKSPGTGWNYAIYDQWDRVVLTQSAEQRAKSTPEWIFMKYDIFNRLVITGVLASASTRETLTTAVANASLRDEQRITTTPAGYTLNRTYPTTATDADLISIMYYDDYNFLTISGWSPDNSLYNYAAEAGYSGIQATSVKGLPTGSKARTQGVNTVWLHSVIHYDRSYQQLQSISSHQHGGTLRAITQYKFDGSVEKTLNKYTYTGGATNVQRRYIYDHIGRPLKIFHKVNSEPEVMISDITYNEMGQPYYSKHHSRNNGNTWLYQTINEYAAQGWTKRVRYEFSDGANVFTQELGYQNSLGTGNTPRFDGLISGNRWQHGAAGPAEVYNYSYDQAKRLTGAAFSQNNSGTWIPNNLFNETGMQYDANGNITALTRNKDVSSTAAQIDNLTYSYTGNRLTAVADNAPAANKAQGLNDGNTIGDDYTYNANGNITSDKNKGITGITYNRLERPERVDFSNGSNIRYTYSSSGVLLTTSYHSTPSGAATKTIQRVGELLFEDNQLKDITHEFGRAITEPVLKYQYFLTDHLGSTRVVLQEDPAVYTTFASFEPEASVEESEQFIHYEDAPRVSSALFDHTDEPGSRNAIRLNGQPGQKMGPARSLSVMPGDTIRMEVFAKYVHTENPDPSALVGIAMHMAGFPAGAVVDGSTANTAAASQGQEALAGLLGDKNQESNAPPAYLNYLFFDRDMQYKDGGYVQLSDAARENGSNVPHEKLSVEFIAPEPGYVYVFLSNDQPHGEVFFDDFSIMTSESYIVQSIDYYPYGLVAKSYERVSERHTKNLFQGKTYEELTQWHDFHARQYDGTLGRWLAVDPQNQYASPYLPMGNNPVMMVDPDGRFAWFIPVIIGAVVGGTAGAIIAHNNDQPWYQGAIVGAFIGAGIGLGVSAAIGPAGGITGMTVGNSAAAGAELTKAWGIASTAIQGANLNMAVSAFGGGSLENIYKAGIVGAASGLFTATGGFGMVKAWGAKSKVAQFFGRQLYQGIGTAGRSIGNNWAAGRDPFSSVTVGVGPVNLTLGKGQQLLQLQNNIGNVATNAFGLTNLLFGGKASFNWQHLTPVYGGGLIDKLFGGTWGAHSILYRTDQFEKEGIRLMNHEFHHIWQSRALGDAFLGNYLVQGLFGMLWPRPFSFSNAFNDPNYFENQAYQSQWF